MKKLICVLSAVFLAVLFVKLIERKMHDELYVRKGPDVPQSPEGPIPWNEAGNYIGATATVEGRVVQTHHATERDGSPTYLSLGKPYDHICIIKVCQHRFYPKFADQAICIGE